MFSILILFVAVHVTICWGPEESYLIISDQIKGFKAYEYSIYDAGSESLLYRIESQFTLKQSLEVIQYPAEKLVGKLQAKFRSWKQYEGNFEVYDVRYHRWMKGVINEIDPRANKWKIQYDNHSISITHNDKGTSVFIEGPDNTVVAQYDWSAAGVFEGFVRYRKFYLNVHSGEIPHMIYFLYIAAVDRNFWQRG